MLMKVHKVFIAILFCNAFIFAQEYNISLWSIPVTRVEMNNKPGEIHFNTCLLYTSPSPRDGLLSRMPSSA